MVVFHFFELAPGGSGVALVASYANRVMNSSSICCTTFASIQQQA